MADRIYNPYPGDWNTYGQSPEFNFFSNAPTPAPPAATTMPGGDVTAPSTVSGMQAARDPGTAGGGDAGGGYGGTDYGVGSAQGTNAAGSTSGLGQMARDTLSAAGSMMPGSLGRGSIAGTLAGAALGLPGVGIMGSMLDRVLGISAGARAGDPVAAHIGSGIPSQMALGSFLDRYGPMTEGELTASGLPPDLSYGMSPSGLAADAVSQGMGLADKSALDMSNAGLGEMTAGQFGISQGTMDALNAAGVDMPGQGPTSADSMGEGDAAAGADPSGGSGDGSNGGGPFARGGHVPALAQMAGGGEVGRAAGRAHRDAPPIQTWIPDYMSETDPPDSLSWGPLRDNAGVARNIEDLMMRIELGNARNAPVTGPIDPVPDRPSYARGGLAQMARHVAGAGRFGDSTLAHVNPDELAMLRAHGSLGTTNPETGLPENFGWKDILGIVAPIAGGLVGNYISPGLGGVIGAGLGGAAGGALTGGAQGAIGEGLLSAGAAYGLQNAFPDTAAALGMGPGSFSDMSLSGLGDSLFGGSGGAPTIGGPGTMLSSDASGNPIAIPSGGAGAAGGAQTAGAAPASGLTQVAAAGQPAASGASGGGGGIGGWLQNNPMKAMAALGLIATMMGQRSNSQQAQATPLPAQTLPASFTAHAPQPQPLQRTQVPYTGDWYTYGLRPEHAFYQNANPPTQYAQGGEVSGEEWGGAAPHAGGGLIDGPGNGQSDDIPENAPADSYIVPADAVADLGDGSTEAGGEALDRELPQGGSGSGLAQAAASSNTGSASVPVVVSRGEYQVPPERVAALGRGNADRGARRLDRMVKNIRRHRATAGHPPRAKPVRTYLGDGS